MVEAMMVVIEAVNISCVDIGVLKLVDNERQYKSLVIAKNSKDFLNIYCYNFHFDSTYYISTVI